ncbi:hypothetical protein IMY05_C4430000300 [Salix suchowensis]|nr:hypothetical protein IMY05_C4430000300 [Salix suchowensis]
MVDGGKAVFANAPICGYPVVYMLPVAISECDLAQTVQVSTSLPSLGNHKCLVAWPFNDYMDILSAHLGTVFGKDKLLAYRPKGTLQFATKSELCPYIVSGYGCTDWVIRNMVLDLVSFPWPISDPFMQHSERMWKALRTMEQPPSNTPHTDIRYPVCKEHNQEVLIYDGRRNDKKGRDGFLMNPEGLAEGLSDLANGRLPALCGTWVIIPTLSSPTKQQSLLSLVTDEITPMYIASLCSQLYGPPEHVEVSGPMDYDDCIHNTASMYVDDEAEEGDGEEAELEEEEDVKEAEEEPEMKLVLVFAILQSIYLFLLGGYKYVLTHYTELAQYVVNGPSLSSLDVSQMGMRYAMIVDHFNKPKAPASNECNNDANLASSSFPPPPPNRETIHAVISSASSKFQPASFEEVGCAVCGQLVLTTKTSALKSVKRMLHVLEAANVTRVECKTKKNAICEFLGPVLNFTTGHICDFCRKCVREGSPIWYITLSPVDIKHLLCVYLAGTDQMFSPRVKQSDERMRLVTSNPVAGARFFNYAVKTFISDVLGFDNELAPGLYGDVKAYFGTVEQQGRLTLHLHAAIWIRGSLSPKELCKCIMSQDSVWNKKLTDWLESCHVGEFTTGPMTDLDIKFKALREDSNYVDPISTLLQVPPKLCSCLQSSEDCPFCCKEEEWWSYYEYELSDLTLYEWVCRCSRIKTTSIKTSASRDNEEVDNDVDLEAEADLLYMSDAARKKLVGGQQVWKDLKLSTQSWEEAFDLVKFTQLQSQLMNNFNLQYECLDARDDFSAKMKDEDA